MIRGTTIRIRQKGVSLNLIVISSLPCQSEAIVVAVGRKTIARIRCCSSHGVIRRPYHDTGFAYDISLDLISSRRRHFNVSRVRWKKVCEPVADAADVKATDCGPAPRNFE